MTWELMSCAALAGQARASWHPLQHDYGQKGLRDEIAIASEMIAAVSPTCQVFLRTLKMIGILLSS